MQQGVTLYAGFLHSDGDNARRLGDVSSDRLHVLQMDVTSDEQVEQCLHYVNSNRKSPGHPREFMH